MLELLLRSLRTAQRDRSLDPLRNEALAAWIVTVPEDDRLEAFLQNVDPAARGALRDSCHEVLKAADSFLQESAAQSHLDMDAFYPALGTHLRTIFPWLTENALAPLSSYIGWYAWRNGY